MTTTSKPRQADKPQRTPIPFDDALRRILSAPPQPIVKPKKRAKKTSK